MVGLAGSTATLLLATPLHAALALEAVAVAAFTDVRCGYIFDALVVMALLITVVLALAEGAGQWAALGASATGFALLILWAASLARGIGLGDVKLASLLGAAFGPTDGIVAIGLSFVLGAGVALGLLATRKARLGTRVCFGPYLLAGSLCLLAYHRLSTGVIR